MFDQNLPEGPDKWWVIQETQRLAHKMDPIVMLMSMAKPIANIK